MAQDLIVISSFPERGGVHTAKTVGVASYTKLLLQDFSLQWQGKITVLAEQFMGATDYLEDGLRVKRVWRRNDLLSLARLLFNLLFRKEQNLLISFEIYMFGGFLANLMVMFTLPFLSLFGKQITLVLHQAPQHLNDLESNWFLVQLKNAILLLWYLYLNFVVQNIVVFEEYLRQGVGRKAIFIPHFVKKNELIYNQQLARQKLSLKPKQKYAMVFGYLAPYKGTAWLLEHWPTDSDYELLVVGGINPNHLQNQSIKNYVGEVYKLAQMKNIRVTGFVDEEMLHDYFTACDLVLLPYQTMFSSSGPLSLAWSHQKPVLLSAKLAPYLESADFALALQEVGLSKADIFFKLSDTDLVKALANFDSRKITKLRGFAKRMQEVRSLRKVASQLVSLLKGEQS